MERWLRDFGEVEFSGPETIVAAIRSRGITLRELSLRHGLSEGACASAIQKPYARAEAVIIGFLGVSGYALWPDRYNSDGTRRVPQPKSNYTPKPRFRRAGVAA